MASVIVNKNEFLSILKSFRGMARGREKNRIAVLCEVLFGEGKLLIKVKSMSYESDCQTEGNGSFTKNYLYFLDVVKQQKEKTIRITTNGQEVRVGDVVFNSVS